MTRYLYGGVADYVLVAGDVDADGLRPIRLKPGAVLRFFSAPDGEPATEHTDLLDYSGDPIAPGGLVADSYGAMPLTYSPDNVLVMYMSADGGARRAIFPVNALPVITSVQDAVTANAAQIQALQDALAVRLPAIQWNQAAGSYPARTPDLAGMRVQWIGPAAPPIAATHAVVGDMWAKTAI